jgi:signal transduction histidine kinase
MRPEQSLRGRFFLALASIVLLLLAIFAVALGLFVVVLEDQLEARVVRIELDELLGREARNSDAAGGQTGGLRRWSVPVEEQDDLPAPLRLMPEGVHEIPLASGATAFAGKRIVDGRVLAVMADIQNVERLELRLVYLGIGTALAAGLLSLLSAAWLSRVALKPITAVVDGLGGLDPSRPRPLLVPGLQTTEARLIARAVDGYQDRLAKLVARERSLTDDISHELRTPTSVIATAAEMLVADSSVVGVARERVARIARASRRTAAVIDALLFLGRDDTLNAPVIADLEAIVKETVDLYLPVARAKQLNLEVHTSGEQLISAPGAAASIVLQNLIENAIRYTDRGKVRVSLDPGRLVVEDTGVGLAGVDPGRIFERGYRSDTSPGSGLGLDLIRRVCDRVGWQVSAQGRPTGGTRFEVCFRRPSEA